jgi:hypothetical protein
VWQVIEGYKRPYRLAKNILSVGVACTLIVFLFTKLYQNYDVFIKQEIFLSPFILSISIIPLIMSYFFVPCVWSMILKCLGSSVTYRKAFQIQYLSHLGKYIPGKIWSYVAQSYLASKINIPVKTTLVSNVILMGIMSISSIVIFSLSFLTWNMFDIYIRFVIVLSCLLIVSMVFMTGILEKFINFVLMHVFKTNMLFRYKDLDYQCLFISIFLDWLMFSTGIYFMVNSFYNIDVVQSIIIVGTFSISWVVGYYAFVAPGGLGIQESVQVYLLNFFFPLPISIVIAFASRLWMTFGDVCVSLLALGSLIHENRVQRSSHGAY